MSDHDPAANAPLPFKVLLLPLAAIAWFCWFSAGTTWRVGAFIGEDDFTHCALVEPDDSPSDHGDAHRSLLPFGVRCSFTDAQQHSSLDAPAPSSQELMAQGLELIVGAGLLLGIRARSPRERRAIAGYVGGFGRLFGVPLGLLLGAILWLSLGAVDGLMAWAIAGFTAAAAVATTSAGIALRRWSKAPTPDHLTHSLASPGV